MTSIKIYVEGGGDGRAGKDALRRGFDAFLREQKRAAQEMGWRWNLVCAGSRDEAFNGFRAASSRPDAGVVVLLVDTEDPLRVSPIEHLRQRDHWDLDAADRQVVHLMVQTMETWIVADVEALADYYGQGFRETALPRHSNLEAVPKRDIERGLENATRATKKGAYHKIHHASPLLGKIDPVRVQERCKACRRFLDYLNGIVA